MIVTSALSVFGVPKTAMMLLWALISIVVVAKSAPIEESETDPCYLKNAHHLTIGSFGYTLTTCFDGKNNYLHA